MGKLTLDPKSVRVESFAPDAAASGAGTVRAAGDSSPLESCMETCYDTVCATCDTCRKPCPSEICVTDDCGTQIEAA